MLKKLLERLKGNKQKEDILKGIIFCNTIYQNNHVDLVHKAFKECYGGKHLGTYDEKLDYIRKGVHHGHESVLEHSNIVTQMIFSNRYGQECKELLALCRYLNVKYSIPEPGIINLYIGGSIRGYKHIIRNCKNLDNALVKTIIEELYNQPSCYFPDFIEDGIMKQELFLDVEDEAAKYHNQKSSKNYDIINLDDVQVLLDLGIDFDDILDLCSVTIYFKDISKSISQQFTRHRAGISQLSQRYVDYSKGFKFNSPADFKPDLYDKNKLYEVFIKDDQKENAIPFKFTLQQLGDAIVEIYGQLREQGLLKEDARSYLPVNVVTSFYMTFTLRNLIKFLQLRTDAHAQAEIRLIAEDVEKDITEFMARYTEKDIYDFLIAYYKMDKLTLGNYDEIDEVIE